MKSFKILSIIFAALLYSTTILAGGYVGDGTIRMMQNAYGSWILITNGAEDNPDDCSKNTVILEKSLAQYEEVYGFLLSAYLAAKPVNIYVNGCDANGYKKFAFVYSSWNN